MAVLLSFLAFAMTALGGIVAMRVHDRVHLVLGLCGGVVLGVVAFDLIPEALRLNHTRVHNIPVVAVAFVCGFLLLHFIEKSIAMHRAQEEGYSPHGHSHGAAGALGGAALVGHSFVDGLSIGLAFQAGSEIALGVAVAVIAHDFADGFNTFTITFLGARDRRRALTMLACDALAPVFGALLTLVISVPDAVLGPYLGMFGGFLLYLAAADILPEAHSSRPAVSTMGATVTGVVLIWIIVGYAG